MYSPSLPLLRYRTAPCFKRVFETLQSGLDDVSSKLNRRNLKAMKERVEQPLRKAYQQLKRISDEQFVMLGMSATARSLAVQEIGSRLNPEFREAVIEDWLTSTEDYNAGKLIGYHTTVRWVDIGLSPAASNVACVNLSFDG